MASAKSADNIGQSCKRRDDGTLWRCPTSLRDITICLRQPIDGIDCGWRNWYCVSSRPSGWHYRCVIPLDNRGCWNVIGGHRRSWPRRHGHHGYLRREVRRIADLDWYNRSVICFSATGRSCRDCNDGRRCDGNRQRHLGLACVNVCKDHGD